MLIKPWTELHPRHILEDEDEDESPDLVPEVSIDCSASCKTILICPQTCRVIADSLPQKVENGAIHISYPQIDQLVKQKFGSGGFEDDYDEDEQLYAAITEKSLKDRFTEMEIPIFEYGLTIVITVPHLTNTVATNVLGTAIVNYFADKVQTWITLSPCPLNNNETVNKFKLGSIPHDSIALIPNIQPPHFITGICGSINSNLSLKNTNLVSLVLNAEGQPGFEKLDNDAIIDTSHIVSGLLGIKDSKYLKSVSLSARKFNGYSNSGMYI